ncbi:MAG: hypothetical protein PHG04_04525 [Candidatus Nanoarchaeia archaeon]|nr:hypothetical protein [Candidatus Nanoarchaeia archaeon]MDD5054608.1 hypothetical protein [Candidatus Nanoarchaeia archaeon]
MIETLNFLLKILALIFGMFSFFKFVSKHEIPELFKLEFFLQANIKDYLIKTFDIEQVKKIAKKFEKEETEGND